MTGSRELFIAGSAYYTQIFAIRVFHHLFATLVFGGWLALRLRRDRGLPNTPLNPLIYLLVGVWLLAGGGTAAGVGLRL